MLLMEQYNTIVTETKLVFAKRGQKVVKKFRCTVGKRKGRIVANPSQCAAPIDLKKRFVLNVQRLPKANVWPRRHREQKEQILQVKL